MFWIWLRICIIVSTVHRGMFYLASVINNYNIHTHCWQLSKLLVSQDLSVNKYIVTICTFLVLQFNLPHEIKIKEHTNIFTVSYWTCLCGNCVFYNCNCRMRSLSTNMSMKSYENGVFCDLTIHLPWTACNIHKCLGMAVWCSAVTD